MNARLRRIEIAKHRLPGLISDLFGNNDMRQSVKLKVISRYTDRTVTIQLTNSQLKTLEALAVPKSLEERYGR